MVHLISNPITPLYRSLNCQGKVVLGLVNEFDSSFINYSDYGVDDPLGNCTVGITTGEEKANVPAIVEPGTALS